MASLTITLDDDLLRRAQIYALRKGTSLDAIVGSCLERIVGGGAAKEAGEELVAIARKARASSAPGGRNWGRDDVYVV